VSEDDERRLLAGRGCELPVMWRVVENRAKAVSPVEDGEFDRLGD
jgi:hypothetical protein